ncbi:hypothetical protein ACFL08_02630 [Patescibacteria group bacterium]
MNFRENRLSLKHFIAGPFIFSMIIPFIFFDLCLEIYHRICFPLYGISLVKRSRYIRVDRHRLSYLSFVEKFYCAYCGYGNGLLHYASIIAGRTEKYWCGIKHKRDDYFVAPSHHKDFLEYGDEETLKGFKKK